MTDMIIGFCAGLFMGVALMSCIVAAKRADESIHRTKGIRCKDCKYYDTEHTDCDGLQTCNRRELSSTHLPNDNFGCIYAERSDNG